VISAVLSAIAAFVYLPAVDLRRDSRGADRRITPSIPRY
jgi:hypothetical protein